MRIVVVVSAVVAGAPAWLTPGIYAVWGPTVAFYTSAISSVHLDVTSLRRHHMTIAYYANVAANTTMEYQVIQHLEGVPTDKS